MTVLVLLIWVRPNSAGARRKLLQNLRHLRSIIRSQEAGRAPMLRNPLRALGDERCWHYQDLPLVNPSLLVIGNSL